MTGFPWVPLGNSQIDVAADRPGRAAWSASTDCRRWSCSAAWRSPGWWWRRPDAAASCRSAGGRRADRRARALGLDARRRRGAADRRHADPRRAGAGQRGARAEVGPRLRGHDLSPLPGDVARGRGPRRDAGDVAGVGDAVLLRGAPGGRGDAAARPRDRRPALRRQRPDRARRQAAPLQQRVPDPADRVGRRHLPQDAPGAVRRVRAARVDPVVRRAARRAGRRLHARPEH